MANTRVEHVVAETGGAKSTRLPEIVQELLVQLGEDPTREGLRETPARAAQALELPTAVDLKIIQSDVAVRGDTATGANKYVTVETGYRVQVPLFVNENDTIRIDTRTGEYVTRV